MDAWYAVHTKPRAEGLANHRLTEQGYETLFLHYRSIVRHARKAREVIRSLYPRYIFVAVNGSQSLYEVSKSHGVSQIVTVGNEPVCIPMAIIEELRELGGDSGEVQIEEKQRKRFKNGQIVQVNDGPFAGLLAEISVDTGKEISVLLQMFRGEVKVKLVAEQLSPVCAARQ